jgi:hypothetical protein
MHHEKYDPVDALAHAIEVCPPCHRSAHKDRHDLTENEGEMLKISCPRRVTNLVNLILRELAEPINSYNDDDVIYTYEIIEPALHFYLDFYIRANNLKEDTEKAKTEEPDYNLVLP